jgi:competence protein ComEA
MKTRLFLVIGALAAAFPALASAQSADTGLPPGPGHEQVETICSACHAPTVVVGQAKTKEQWSEVVDQMIGRGAAVADADYGPIVDYLTKNFGVAGAPAAPAVPAAAPAAAPAKKPS